MAIDPWLPVGFLLPGSVRTRSLQFEGTDWQIYETAPAGEALVAKEGLARRWLSAGLLSPGALEETKYGTETLFVLTSGPNHRLAPVEVCPAPRNVGEARSLAVSMAETRKREGSASLHDAIYVERFSRLLPVWSLSPAIGDEFVLGAYLSGGMRVSARATRRMEALVRALSATDIQTVADAAGVGASGSPSDQAAEGNAATESRGSSGEPEAGASRRQFSLPGRAQLESFFREHVVDIVENAERYKALGISFPGAIALFGPPGSGKTFAVEKLVEYLGWPNFSVDSTSIGSPYVHETGRKIGRIFEEAIQAAPSVLVIDEMEAFLSDRQAGGESGQHRVEEVAEFLRRIPEAAKRQVLIVGMTNRIEAIDPAILRRGRFDHVIEVGMPSAEEVRALMTQLLSAVAVDVDCDATPLVAELAGRALSDAAFVVREGARLAARSGRSSIDQASLVAALRSLPPRGGPGPAPRRMGFT